ncbi:MAG TPA: PKD domain-containing protein, partial [Anaerolineae bacterium]|nr:PKD domain-containing protein [Anaerolineae bacterium]
MTSYHRIVARGWRVMVVLALMLSTMPLDVAAAQPMESVGQPTIRSAVAATAGDSIEESRQTRDQAAALDQIVQPAPSAPNAVDITATKRDALVVDVDNDNRADPGDTLEYTVVLTDSGSTDATGVQFNDTLDANTTLVGGSLSASPVAVNDTYPQTIIGNVSINSALIPFSVISNDYVGLNPAATITAYDATSANGGTVVVNTDGTFTYDPPPGFEGTDTFSYTLSNSTGSSIAAVSISVSGMVWFVNSTAPSCTSVSNGCGRLSHPFSTLAAFNTANGAADVPASHIFNPAANDNVFIYENAAAYTGAVTLLSGQKLIGQDATASLSAITGLTPPSSSASFPAMNSGNATFTNIVSTVTLNNNVTVRGLQINSTTSTGMNDPASAISGVNVSEVSIATTTGTAVLLSSTGGIFSFTSVSANGAANGISLAGTTGSFTVTGNGGTCTSLASTCTGGAIQNTTGHGISLSNVASPSFNYMKIANNANSGIFGTGVVNFTLANSVIDGVNTAHTSTDGDVAFNLNGGGSTENNLSGNVSITNNTLNNSYQDGINILNYAGTISNLTITNNHLTSNSNAANSAGSAILVVEGRGASASFITAGNISGNTINNFPNGGGVVVHVGNTAAGPSGSIASLANPLLIQDNVITGAGAGASGLGTNGVELTVGHQSDGYFTVGGAGHGNTITNVRGNGVACSKFGDNGSSGSTKCTISFNTVNAHNTVNSPGINTGADSATSNTNTPTLYLSIHDNNISNTTGNGILSTVRSTNGTGVFSIQNNTIAQPTTSSGTIYGIRVDSGNGAEATGATVCLKISGNTTAGSTNGSITAPGIGLRQNHTAIVSSFQIDGLSPTPANDAQMEAYVGNVGQNPGSANGTFGATGVAAISGGGTYTAGTCIIPGPVAFNLDTPAVAENSPAVQLTARNDVAAQTAEVVPASQSIVSAMPLEFAGAFKQTTWHETNYVTSIAPATVNAPNSGETVNVTIGPLPSNKSITIKFRASINDPIPAGILQVSNQGTVSGGNFSNVLTDDPDTGIANDPTVTPLDIQVDLQITKAVSPTTAYPGAPITYTIAYLNAGPQASANVVISDPLPSALTNVTYQSSATITPTGSYVWTIGTLSNGQGGTITVTGMISSALGVPTTITNTATITGTGRDTNASNNTASVGLPITDQPIGGLNAANSSPTQLGSATNFTATVSAGTSVVYQWNFGDGATSSGATSAHTYAAVGMYTATVTATNSANSQVATTSVTVVDVPISGLNAANSSPTRLGSATNFTATISSGSNVAYAWNFGDGATGSGATSAHTYATIGTYTATVTATNSVNQQVAATVVTVIDRPISGLTAANDSPTQLGNTTHFTATISGGSNVAYQWNFGDGAVASGANTSHIYGAVGSYVATVTATNGVSVVVASTNASIVDVPISGLTATNSSPTVLGNSTAFTAAISGGTNATYAWNFGDGSTGSGANASHIYAAIGAYTATVTATNTSGSVIATTVATIYDTPITGLTAASNSPTRLGNATHFTATTTGGSGIGYAWSFGDGNVGSGANPSHTYAALGTYTATVTATNSLNSQTANTIVVVIDQPIVGLAAA